MNPPLTGVCRKALHDVRVTGLTADRRCLQCRRASHRRAQRRYEQTSKGLIQTGHRNDAHDRRKARERLGDLS